MIHVALEVSLKRGSDEKDDILKVETGMMQERYGAHVLAEMNE